MVTLDRIEILGRIGHVTGALGECRAGGQRHSKAGEAGPGQKAAAVKEQALGRGKARRNLPSAAANDMHGLILRIRCLPRIRRPAITGKSRLWQCQVMRQQSIRPGLGAEPMRGAGGGD